MKWDKCVVGALCGALVACGCGDKRKDTEPGASEVSKVSKSVSNNSQPVVTVATSSPQTVTTPAVAVATQTNAGPTNKAKLLDPVKTTVTTPGGFQGTNRIPER